MSIGSLFNSRAQHPMYRAGVMMGMVMGKPLEAKSRFMDVLRAGGNMMGIALEKIANAKIVKPVLSVARHALSPRGPNAPQS